MSVTQKPLRLSETLKVAVNRFWVGVKEGVFVVVGVLVVVGVGVGQTVSLSETKA